MRKYPSSSTSTCTLAAPSSTSSTHYQAVLSRSHLQATATPYPAHVHSYQYQTQFRKDQTRERLLRFPLRTDCREDAADCWSLRFCLPVPSLLPKAAKQTPDFLRDFPRRGSACCKDSLSRRRGRAEARRSASRNRRMMCSSMTIVVQVAGKRVWYMGAGQEGAWYIGHFGEDQKRHGDVSGL